MLLLVELTAAFLLFGAARAGTPSPALYFDQLVDHLRPENSSDNPRRTWKQRYYSFDEHFGGPGSPIFLIMGGEGAIEPSTGLMYPFVTHHLAVSFQAYVVQPEHRFYGASQPISPCEIHMIRQQNKTDPRLVLLTYEQALLDAKSLVLATQRSLGCSRDRFSDDYCPVISVGGSYPGFLATMARIAMPEVVDMAYAASAPMNFYAQRVGQFDYYNHITNVAEGAVVGCADGVRSTLLAVQEAFRQNPTIDKHSIGACTGSIPAYCGNHTSTFLEEVFMMVGYTFANHNMAYYPPTNQTRLHQACEIFVSDLPPMDKLRTFFVQALAQRPNDTCFDMEHQRPAGPRATISAGDWSGVGTGQSGESWDFQTCTLCVESIGFNSTTSMFPDRLWSLEWLTQHCQSRFGVTPQPNNLNQRWHVDDMTKTGATRILFTNGLHDGWSVSGIQHNVSATIRAINFPNGAHHSDLSGRGPTENDTMDIREGFVQIRTILAEWLNQLHQEQRPTPHDK